MATRLQTRRAPKGESFASPEPTALPRSGAQTGGPKRYKNRRTAEIRAWVFMGVLLFGGVFGLIGGCAGLLSSAATTTQTTQANQFSFRGQAEAALLAWLNGTSPNVPIAANIDPAFGRTGTRNSDGSFKAPEPIAYDYYVWQGAEESVLSARPNELPQRVERHRFFVSINGNPLNVTIPVAETPSGPVIGGLPSVSPVPQLSDEDRRAMGWGNFNSVQPGQNVVQQVIEWAKAYTTNNTLRLYNLTGEKRNVVYPGLEGFQFVDATVRPEAVVDGSGKIMGVRALVTMAPVANPAQVMTVEYDLLLSDLQAALPTVVAWGPAGSGPFLTPYGNAVEPRRGTTLSSTEDTSVPDDGASDNMTSVPADSTPAG